MSKAIVVPAGFSPRDYQKPLFNALGKGFKRGIAVWHRRAGKDKIFMAMLASAAVQRTGIYFYILPYYKQARKVIWEGMDAKGVPNLAVFPDEVIKHKNNQEMILTLINGSIIYFLGSDNIDSIVGTNPIGIFFSEYSVHKPHVWDYLRPILVENGGFAFFNGTPRGKNHMYTMLKAAEDSEEWYHEVLTIDDTGVMTKEQVEQEVVEGMDRATANQEFFCSFEAALAGAYYEEAMQDMATSGRIRKCPLDPYVPVNVAWDLGVSDTMVLIFSQTVGEEEHIIDVMANSGKGLDWYVAELQKKRYIYGNHFLPHDIKQRELTYGKSRLSTLYELGLKNITVLKKAPIADGINEARKLLYRTVINDVPETAKLQEALKSYRRAWDNEKQVYSNTPMHDWASHYADAFRQLAMGRRSKTDTTQLARVAEGTGYDPFSMQNIKHHKMIEPMFGSRYGADFTRMAWDPMDHLTADAYYERV